MNELYRDNLERKIKLLPTSSGVYLMKDRDDTVIYVGKAKVLKNRVTQYFRKNASHTPKVLHMVENIADFEYIITDNEMEALILECNLIKEYRPYYNILMRDDKSYPYIKVTVKDDFPRIFVTRKYVNDGNRYFGPYANATHANQTVATLNEMYPTVMCKKKLKAGTVTGDLCLNYHMGLCKGACQGYITKEEYGKYVDEIIDILNGKNRKIINLLTDKMMKYSENLDFENAGKIRDRIYAIKGIDSRQTVSNTTADNMDIIGIAIGEDLSCAQVYELRDKKIVGRENFILRDQGDTEVSEIISAFIKQYYTNLPYIPPAIAVEKDFEERESLEELLTKLASRKISIHIPKRGEKKKLLDLAKENAGIYIENTVGREKQKLMMEKLSVRELNEYAGVHNETPRFEAYDISNIAGSNNIGVMVVFEGSKKNPKQYRKFRVKSVDGQDDYASMMEVVFRRLNRALKEKQSGEANPRFLPVPDVIFVDGGIGHIHAVKSITDLFDFDIKVLGLEKNSKHKLKNVVKDDNTKKRSADFEFSEKLLNDISEEVHRYAIEYHRKLRSKSLLKSSLEEIEGIGSTRAKNLMKAFKNTDKLRDADLDEIASVKGMTRKSAENVKKYLDENL